MHFRWAIACYDPESPFIWLPIAYCCSAELAIITTNCLRTPEKIFLIVLIEVSRGIIILYSFGVLKQMVDQERLNG